MIMIHAACSKGHILKKLGFVLELKIKKYIHFIVTSFRLFIQPVNNALSFFIIYFQLEKIMELHALQKKLVSC